MIVIAAPSEAQLRKQGPFPSATLERGAEERNLGTGVSLKMIAFDAQQRTLRREDGGGSKRLAELLTAAGLTRDVKTERLL
jgi:hypothetical protein